MRRVPGTQQKGSDGCANELDEGCTFSNSSTFFDYIIATHDSPRIATAHYSDN